MTKPNKGGKLSAAAEQPKLPTGPVRELSFSTFRDWGQRLPIGFLAGGELHRSFAFKSFRMREEKQLEGLRKEAGRLSIPEFISNVLAHMLTQLGPHSDFQTLKEQERRLIISQMWLGDVMYSYIWLRIEALGEIINFNVECPRCSAKNKLPADLYDTDVKVAEDEGSLARVHELTHGIETPEGVVKQVVLQPPRWSTMLGLKGGAVGFGDIKTALISSSIRQLGTGKHPVTPGLLDNLTKRDMEMLTKVVDELSPGPDMTLEATCPACRLEIKNPLDWSWDFFFTAASL